MSFSRTPSGLTNMATFCSADFIVFTEGGSGSFTAEEALDGNFNTMSVDIKFWSTVFNKYGFNKRLHFRALGSKTSAEELALKAERSEVSNILVVRDSDLDDFLQRKIDSPFVLYTYGYSWENDTWHKDSIISQIECFNMSTALPENCRESIDKSFSALDKYARRLLLLELIFRKNGLKFITECTGEQFINNRSQPILKSEPFLRQLKKNKDKIVRPVNNTFTINIDSAVRYCYGKLYECLGYNALCYVCKTYLGIKSLPKQLITSAMIERFAKLEDHRIDQHYQGMINRLNTSLAPPILNEIP
ncbi:DUF4435 domain-containing protein [Citrobacter europaeus]|uniref:DUF4435 domain-containing protein n=1 Tax=Citrobacter europaeus TaxID=1914243 RepID=UPI001BCA78FD|nr:DUF4435 domain-containing protein [Citrobacter europaeus]